MNSLEKIANESKASQGKRELLWLLKKVSSIKPKVIVEVGVHQGYSMETWREAFDPELLIGIENDINGLNYDDFVLLYCSSHELRTLKLLKETLDREKIDFLFIDGDHSYEGVKKDFEMYGPLVRKGGMIALHDIRLDGHPNVKVKKFWDGYIEDHYTNEWYQSGGTGVGIIYV